MAAAKALRQLLGSTHLLVSRKWKAQSTFIGLGVAAVSVATAIFVRMVLLAELGPLLAYITLYPAVTISSAVGGYRAGVAATALSAVGITVVLAPLTHPADWLGMVTFLVGCGLIVGVTEAMHYAQSRAVEAEAEARHAGELAESEGRFKAVVDSAADGIITIDEGGIVRSLNPAAVSLFGYEREDVTGKNVSILMPEPYASRHDHYLRRYLHTGEARIVGIGREVEGRRRDGSVFPMELSVSEASLKGERLFIGVTRDISERRKADERQQKLTEELQESEIEARRQKALFEGVFDSAPEAIVLCDLDYRALMINPAFRRLFGYQDAEFAGQPQLRIFADNGEWKRVEGAHFGRAGARNLEPSAARFKRKDGEIFPGEIIASIYRDQHGTPQGHVSIIRDLTQEHQREEAQQRSQKLEVVGQLTGGVAHDFNNLLTVIIGNLELLEMRLEEEPLKVMLGKALNAADMGQRLTDSLLTFARRQTLTPERVDLNEVVLSLTDMLRRTLGPDIDMATSLSPNLRHVVADRGRIESAILNLALNARDAMREGGRLVIETTNVELGEHIAMEDGAPAPGPYVRLSVSDSGEGMDPDVQERAFEPFFTTKPTGRGTGLGLSTIYGFARQSGGHAVIESEPGRGTTVYLELPAGAPASADLEAKTARHAPRDKVQAGRILVVEDDERVRDLTVARLRNLGYEVLEAGDGPQALQVLGEQERVDLVFIDLIMPGGISGLDLCDMVREKWPHVRPLLTSGYAEELTSSGHLERNQVQLLRKPYRQAELARAIENTLNPQ